MDRVRSLLHRIMEAHVEHLVCAQDYYKLETMVFTTAEFTSTITPDYICCRVLWHQKDGESRCKESHTIQDRI